MATLCTLLALVPFYLLGAFPTGTLIAKKHGVDLRNAGSGNVGATNIARVIGKKAGLVTLVIDVFKGACGAAIAAWVADSASFTGMAAVACVAGHCFSIPGKLRGGKGVATALGASAFLAPLAAVIAVAVFAVVFGAFRIVSLASVTATLAAPIVLIFGGGNQEYFAPIVLIALIVTLRHKNNLERLVRGEEPRFGPKSLENAAK